VDGRVVQSGLASETYNCTIHNTTSSAGLTVQGGKATNCYVYSSVADAISSNSNASIISNCTGISDGSEGIFINKGKIYNCLGKSTASYGIYLTQATSYAYNCTAESSANAAIRLNTSKIYNCQAICTWNDVSGDGIVVTQGNGFEIVDCYAEVVNSSAHAVDGNQSGIIKGLSGKGMTTLIGTTTNTLTNTVDSAGNIILA